MMTRSGVESLGFLLGEMDWKRTLCKNWMKKNRTKKIFKNTLCYGGNVTQIIKSSKGVVASVTVTVTAAATSTLAFLSLAFLTATALATTSR